MAAAHRQCVVCVYIYIYVQGIEKMGCRGLGELLPLNCTPVGVLACSISSGGCAMRNSTSSTTEELFHVQESSPTAAPQDGSKRGGCQRLPCACKLSSVTLGTGKSSEADPAFLQQQHLV